MNKKEICEAKIQEILVEDGFKFAYKEIRINGELKSGEIILVEVDDGRSNPNSN